MKVKTKDLTGPALDWAVAKCEGWNAEVAPSDRPTDVWLWRRRESGANDTAWLSERKYSTNWARGGPIIEREITRLFKNLGGTFTAQIRYETEHPLVSHRVLTGWTNGSGPTPLIAAMRCFVASRLGDEIDIPKELT